jgi:hypothetical protein
MESEEIRARRAAREMRNAALIITGSFVFVLVMVVLVVVIGHIRLF